MKSSLQLALLTWWAGTTPRTVADKEWWQATDKKFQAWPRTAGLPVVMNPISRQNFIVKDLKPWGGSACSKFSNACTALPFCCHNIIAAGWFNHGFILALKLLTLKSPFPGSCSDLWTRLNVTLVAASCSPVDCSCKLLYKLLYAWSVWCIPTPEYNHCLVWIKQFFVTVCLNSERKEWIWSSSSICLRQCPVLGTVMLTVAWTFRPCSVCLSLVSCDLCV